MNAVFSGGAPSGGWLSMPTLRFRRAWLLAAALAVAIVLLLGVTRVPASLKWLMVDDKLMHAAAYAAMSAAFAQLLLDRRARLLIVLMLVVFGLAVECLQAQTATRQFELLDLFANAGGAFGAWLLVGRREVSLLPRLEALCSRDVPPQRAKVSDAQRLSQSAPLSSIRCREGRRSRTALRR